MRKLKKRKLKPVDIKCLIHSQIMDQVRDQISDQVRYQVSDKIWIEVDAEMILGIEDDIAFFTVEKIRGR